MGLLHKLRHKLKALLSGNAKKIKDGVDKAGDIVDDKTGGKHTDNIEMAEEKIGDVVDDAVVEADVVEDAVSDAVSDDAADA